LKCSDQKPSSEALATDFSVCIGLPDALATFPTIAEDNLEPKNYLFINNKDKPLPKNYLLANREDNLATMAYLLLLKKDNFLPKGYLIINIIRNFAPKRRLR
jgi:hypothetical protein